MSYVFVNLMFNDLRSEVIVRFAGIGGIFCHHCLNFLFVKENLVTVSWIQMTTVMSISLFNSLIS